MIKGAQLGRNRKGGSRASEGFYEIWGRDGAGRWGEGVRGWGVFLMRGSQALVELEESYGHGP